jgi:hypothetical protein
MKQLLTLLELGGTRRAVAISFSVALLAAILAVFPSVDAVYNNYPLLRHLIDVVIVVTGPLLAILELRHSSEANEHRAEHNRLTDEANARRAEANRYREEANRLGDKALGLQIQVHQLQESIERKLTKIRLFPRAHKAREGVKLLVANLSDFDLWINEVRLVVRKAEDASPETSVIGGGNRISQGKTEEGYNLNSHLVAISANRSGWIKFVVSVIAVGISEDPVTIDSPVYSLTFVGGQPTELKTLSYTAGIAGL